jgi:hypothetical protein
VYCEDKKSEREDGEILTLIKHSKLEIFFFICFCHGFLLLKERRTKTQRGYLDTSLIRMKIEQYRKPWKNQKQPYLTKTGTITHKTQHKTGYLNMAPNQRQ